MRLWQNNGEVYVMDDIKLAQLGDKEAAKRLTDAGVLVPCPMCNETESLAEVKETLSGLLCCHYILCECGCEGPARTNKYEARLAWNTRAPILSSEEMEMLEGME